jgi:hypothetical protein
MIVISDETGRVLYRSDRYRLVLGEIPEFGVVTIIQLRTVSNEGESTGLVNIALPSEDVQSLQKALQDLSVSHALYVIAKITRDEKSRRKN